MKKKFLTVALAATMVLSSAVNALAADLPEPVAAYDFTGSKLADTSNHKLADLKLDALNPDGKDEVGVTSGNAEVTADGLVLTNGYIMLPDNVFSDSNVDDIKGITVSMTYTRNERPEWASTWGGEWSESLFCFSKTRLVGDLAPADVQGEPTDKSFYCSVNGNVGTGKNLYKDNGNWIDGGLNGVLNVGEKHVVTVTYDIATNVVTEYVDGEYVTDSTKMEWEAQCSLTAQDIKDFKALNIGHHIDGAWGMWSFCTVADFKVYTSALSADQVKALAAGSVSSGSQTSTKPVQTGDATNALPVVMIALVACAVVVLRRKSVTE